MQKGENERPNACIVLRRLYLPFRPGCGMLRTVNKGTRLCLIDGPRRYKIILFYHTWEGLSTLTLVFLWKNMKKAHDSQPQAAVGFLKLCYISASSCSSSVWEKRYTWSQN